MVIEFYYHATSPACRTVWMVLKALGLEFEFNSIYLMKGDQRTPEYLAINLRGKIPSLKDGNFIIAESRAISTYLCNQYEKGDDSTRLYPVDPKKRGLVDQILYVSEYMDDVIKAYVNTRGVIFQGEKPREEKLADVYEALKLYEGSLTRNKYMAGDHLTLADFFMMSPILTLEVPGFNNFEKYPKTFSWLKSLKELSYFDECNEEGQNVFKTAYHNALSKSKA